VTEICPYFSFSSFKVILEMRNYEIPSSSKKFHRLPIDFPSLATPAKIYK
jgi:hypothetical protein